MELQRFRLPFAFALTFLYNVLFWQEALGLNLVLFSLLIIGIVLFLNPGARHSQVVWLTAIGTVASGIFVLLHNSGAAKVSHILSLLVFTGFAHLPGLRSHAYAVVAIGASYIQSALSLYEEAQEFSERYAGLKQVWRYSRLIIIPLIVLSIFFLIFLKANPRFATISEEFFDQIGLWLADFSIVRFLFLMLGFFIATGLIYNRHLMGLAKHEDSHPDQLYRQRRKVAFSFSPIGLKKEYLMGIMLMGLVNVLLFLNNAIDIEWIWFNFEVEEGFNLTQFVHEGTYLLILSILFSMGIMLYYFRNNQHFFHKNGWLHRLSYLWIIQNTVLLISVGIRNYHYIAWHGLAYKRIGVIFFLLLTLCGLLTLFWKIQRAKSLFYLFRINGWAVYGVMLTLAVINWDGVITRYNLTQDYPGELDRTFLLNMSDKTLPLLLEHQDVFAPENGGSTQDINVLRIRIGEFREKYESHSWLSWNRAEYMAYQYLHQRGFKAAITSPSLTPLTHRP